MSHVKTLNCQLRLQEEGSPGVLAFPYLASYPFVHRFTEASPTLLHSFCLACKACWKPPGWASKWLCARAPC
jgi:hypothetical protein